MVLMRNDALGDVNKKTLTERLREQREKDALTGTSKKNLLEKVREQNIMTGASGRSLLERLREQGTVTGTDKKTILEMVREQAEYKRYCDEAKGLSINLESMLPLVVESNPRHSFLIWQKGQFCVTALTCRSRMLDVTFDTADTWARKFHFPLDSTLEEPAIGSYAEFPFDFRTPGALLSQKEEERKTSLEWEKYKRHCSSVEQFDVQQVCDAICAAVPDSFSLEWEKNDLKVGFRVNTFSGGLQVKFETSKGSRKFIFPIIRSRKGPVSEEDALEKL